MVKVIIYFIFFLKIVLEVRCYNYIIYFLFIWIWGFFVYVRLSCLFFLEVMECEGEVMVGLEFLWFILF